MVVGDFLKFPGDEGIVGVLVLGFHCVLLLLRQVSMGETQSSVKILP